MLRGQASLQELIGRSYMNRKRPASKSKKQAEIGESSASIAKPTLPKLKTLDSDPPVSSSLQPGQVTCPVCGMPVLEREMNKHLGKIYTEPHQNC